VTNRTRRNGNWLAQAVTGHRTTWDFDNQLPGVDTSGDQVADVTFGYDALGRRVKKTASGATKIYVSATPPIAYSPQAGQELAEYVSGAATLHRDSPVTITPKPSNRNTNPIMDQPPRASRVCTE
jgi:hypothetical protein